MLRYRTWTAGSLIRSRVCFEGEETPVEPTEGSSGKEGEKGKETPPPTQTTQTRTFTQAQVDAMMARDKDRAKKERDALQQQLNALKEQGLTPENLTALNDRIEQLDREGKTKEELAKEELAKKDKEWTSKLKKSEGDAENWRKQYETYRISTELLSAGNEEKAINPEQLYKLLRGDTTLVPVLDENKKPTGEYVPRVKLATTDDEGKAVVLELSPIEAVKRMKEMDTHRNLFHSGGTNGLGSFNTGGNGGKGVIPVNQEEYNKARKKPGFYKQVGQT